MDEARTTETQNAYRVARKGGQRARYLNCELEPEGVYVRDPIDGKASWDRNDVEWRFYPWSQVEYVESFAWTPDEVAS